MNVALYRATSNPGNHILHERISRGHQITAVARDISKVPSTVVPEIVSLGIDPESRSVGSVTPTFAFKQTLCFFPSPFLQQSGHPHNLNYASMWIGFKF